jgi:hypothetical protein
MRCLIGVAARSYPLFVNVMHAMLVARCCAQFIKQHFAISKNQNTWMMEIQGVTAIFVMWVMFKPLIQTLGERRYVPSGPKNPENILTEPIRKRCGVRTGSLYLGSR